MLIQDIEQATLDFIRTFSKREYIGKIKVEKLIPKGYEVTLYHQDIPTVFYAELEGEDFLKFLREEIRNKKFHLSKYGKLDKIEPCHPISKPCSCNDTRRID